MKQVNHIFIKEFTSYFISPIAYFVISIFLLITGWFFFSSFFLSNQANLRSFFSLLPITFSFVVPAVTMRLLSEEINIGTYETLLTLPVTFRDVLLGKFLAATAFTAAMLIPTLSYPFFISLLGDIDWGPVVGGYTGAVLLGAAFSSIGLFASSMTRNQVIALIIGMAICFFLTLIDKMLFFFPSPIVGFLQYIAAGYHFQNISKGVIDSRDILYFLSLSFLGLYGSHLILQEKY